MPESLSKKLFFFVLIFSPLAFGTVEPWSYAIMEITVFLAILLYFIGLSKTNNQLYSVPGIVPLCLFLVYILIQITPLPSQMIKIISPASYAIQDAKSFMTISIHPRATLLEFFRYATYVAFYVFTVQILSNKNLLKKTVLVITIFGSVLAFSSILQLYLTENMALWVRYCPDRPAIMGPYINYNHYAGLMGMIFPVALALFLFHKPKAENSNFFQGILEILKQEKANIHILIGTGALLIVTSIFVCLSRGGIISTCVGLLFFLFLSFKKKASQKGSLLIICLVLIAGLSISWFGWSNIQKRFSSISNTGGTISGERLDYWKDSQNIIKKFPLTGSGFGTFKDIYPSVQSTYDNAYIEHAHNDYIELMTEGGAIGFFLVFSILISIFYKTYKSFSLRKDSYSIYIYIGSITGIISILVHSFSDFNMHIGANGLWFSFTAALAVSASNTRLRVKKITTNLLPVQSTKIKHASFASISILFLIILISNISILTANFYSSHIKNVNIGFKTPTAELKRILKIANHASAFDPLNSDHLYTMANVSWFLRENKQAKAYYLKSIKLDPANSQHVKQYGLFLTQTNEIAKAEQMLKKSIRLNISSSDNVFQYGGLLLSTGQKEKSIKYFKKAMSIDQEIIGQVLTTMAAANLTLEEMEQTIPEDLKTELFFADFLNQIGETTKAGIKYLNILDSLSNNKKVSRHQIYKIYNFFKSQGNLFQTTQVLEKGTILMPSDASIRISLGDLYLKQGILFKAKEQYEKAIIIDPKNQNTKVRLKKLNQ